jgi:F-type H+-transporting ATPase subunit gamma
MASLRAIRTRIKSVRNTQKITSAMKMVSAAKLRRAQDAVVRARPYAQLIDDMLSSLARKTEEPASPATGGGRRPEHPTEEAGEPLHPLMQVREVKRAEVVMMTSDRGLCGGFNSNIVRRGQRFLVEEADRMSFVQCSTVGRRGRDFARKRGIETRKDYVGFLGKLRYAHAQEIADDVISAYTEGKLDAVFLLYNEFKSVIQQRISLVQLLPIVPKAQRPEEHEEPHGKGAHGGREDEAGAPRRPGSPLSTVQPAPHLFEPSRAEVLDRIVPRHLAMQIWRALLESEASEHGARMTAMDSATKNANEMISRLTLQYNCARQAAITKELMEIVSGAEALR